MDITRAGIITVIAAALALSACGSSSKVSDSSNPTSSAPPTSIRKPLPQSEYVTAANAICTKYNQQMAALSAKIPTDVDAKELAAQVRDKLIPVTLKEISELEQLNPPAADNAKLTAIFDEVDAAAADLQLKIQDDPTYATSTEYQPFNAANKKLQAYGLTECDL